MKFAFLYLFIMMVQGLEREPAIFDMRFNVPQVNRFLKSGAFDGFFYPNQFWNWHKDLLLNKKNRKVVSRRVTIGHSFEGRKIDGFYMTNDTAKIDLYKNTKNIIFFTGLHHSREPLSVTMIMLMVIEILKNYQKEEHSLMKELFRDNIIFFVPMLNIDSYTFITRMHQTRQLTEDIKMIRKNRNIHPSCTIESGGVDLNRNYDYKFGLDNKGSSDNPCQEDYRGPEPFSEPETKAIKHYVDTHKNIVSCVNIHSYGNAWIYPFNFVHDGSDHLLNVKRPLFGQFYEQFKQEMQDKGHKAFYGNAAFVLDYAANGEAGDWYAGAKNILNIDVELGDTSKDSDRFYVRRELIPKIVRYNWIVMKEYLKKHTVTFSLKSIIINKAEPVVTFEILNNSISSLIHMLGIVKPLFKDEEEIKYNMEYGVKALITDHITHTDVIGNQIPLTFKGRHILELSIFFETFIDMQKLHALEFLVKRNEVNYLSYPDQKYLFRLKQFLKNK